MTAPKTLWLIGCGNMAGAMLRRWIAAGTVRGENVFVLNRREQGLPAGVRQGRGLPDGALPDAVMLGVKPQQIDDVAGQMAERIAGVPLLVSILAGADEAALATVEGGALLAVQSADAPATLADRVASPGGSTREGLNVLDKDEALRRLLIETLAASVRRNGEMAAAARAS